MTEAREQGAAVRNPLSDLVGTDSVTLPELLSARVRESPSADFLIWEGRTWTYRQAWEEVLRFSGWARSEYPVDSSSRVASYLPNRPETIWTWFGSLAAGAGYVPLNREHRGPVLADMVERAQPDLVVTDAEGLESLSRTGHIQGTPVVLVDAEGSRVQSRRVVPWAQIDAGTPGELASTEPGDLAELIYTSGTTGPSKAVRLSHTQLCRGAGWVAWSLGLTAEDVFHAWLPLFHIAGQTDSVLPMIISGGKIALFPTFSRSRFFEQVRSTSATIFIGFSNVAELLLSLPEDETEHDTLRAGVVGAVSGPLRQAFEERFGVTLHDIYGMTEAEPMVLSHPGESCPAGSCGRPSPDLEVVVLGPDDIPVEAGGIGEICVRPRRVDALTSGYEGDPTATLEATRGLWFRTGDLGRTDADGFFYFVDRLKHSIRRRGENISSWELENTVLQHPQVKECCAIGVPSPLGDDDVKIVVGIGEGRELDPAALRDWCQGQMAKFMVPRYIEIAAELPRAPTGKVLKEELRSDSEATWDAEAAAV